MWRYGALVCFGEAERRQPLVDVRVITLTVLPGFIRIMIALVAASLPLLSTLIGNGGHRPIIRRGGSCVMDKSRHCRDVCGNRRATDRVVRPDSLTPLQLPSPPNL